jgi:hypothetical protein
MSDWTDMAVDFFKMLFVGALMIAIIATLGFFAGKKYGYAEGIKDCNNETIAKQLGYDR